MQNQLLKCLEIEDAKTAFLHCREAIIDNFLSFLFFLIFL